MLKSAGLTVCAQQECDCIPGIAPQSPAASRQHPRSAAVMSSLGTRHAITGVASSTAKAANNPSFLPARIIKTSVGSFGELHKEGTSYWQPRRFGLLIPLIESGPERSPCARFDLAIRLM
jgi:hypothetical protein